MCSYRHVGARPRFNLRDLTPEECEHYGRYGYVKYEEAPGGGRLWTEKMLHSGCNTVTTISQEAAEIYGVTFCACCGSHFPVSEFILVNNKESLNGKGP